MRDGVGRRVGVIRGMVRMMDERIMVVQVEVEVEVEEVLGGCWYWCWYWCCHWLPLLLLTGTGTVELVACTITAAC